MPNIQPDQANEGHLLVQNFHLRLRFLSEKNTELEVYEEDGDIYLITYPKEMHGKQRRYLIEPTTGIIVPCGD